MVKPLVLPARLNDTLQHSPLKLVVCQVRHNHIFAVSDPDRAFKTQQLLGDPYPQIDAFEQSDVIFTAGPGVANADTKPPQQGWQFKSKDQRWTATLQTTYFSLETSAYISWVDFRTRFTKIMSVVLKQYGPRLEQRVGLRYVDEIERRSARQPSDWVGLIRPSVLGPLGDPDLAPSVRAAQQLVDFEGPDQTRVVLRHGCEPRGGGQGTVYRLDHDCSRERGRAFDVDQILTTLESLHTLALQVFQSAITKKLYSELKGREIAE